MGDDHIRYDILAQDALRGVIRKVLSEVAKTGLPGEHHFYVTFATRAPGVRISSRLIGQYPEFMTIVLQHQFWDLTVTEQAFEIGLSFGGTPERLLVPFTAVKAFVDPSVPFTLQFEPAEAEPAEETAAPATDGGAPAELPVPAAEAKPAPAAEKPAAEGKPDAGAAVVSLDAFRRKT